MNVVIRPAKENDNATLTSISFAAKRYWKYPEEYFEVWKNELTITQKYIAQNKVYVAEIDEKPVGFIAIVEVKKDLLVGDFLIRKGFWIDHIFIHPDLIGMGVGTRLITFVKENYRGSIECLLILSDPNATGFYDKIGAKYIEQVPSSIKGRTVSLYELPM